VHGVIKPRVDLFDQHAGYRPCPTDHGVESGMGGTGATALSRAGARRVGPPERGTHLRRCVRRAARERHPTAAAHPEAVEAPTPVRELGELGPLQRIDRPTEERGAGYSTKYEADTVGGDLAHPYRQARAGHHFFARTKIGLGANTFPARVRAGASTCGGPTEAFGVHGN
jgi:hypothetical protein